MPGVLILTPSERVRLVALLDTTAHYIRDVAIILTPVVLLAPKIVNVLNASLNVLLTVRNVISGEHFGSYFEGEV